MNIFKQIDFKNIDKFVMHKEWLFDASQFNLNSFEDGVELNSPQMYKGVFNSTNVLDISSNVTEHHLYKVISNLFYNDKWLDEYYHFIQVLDSEEGGTAHLPTGSEEDGSAANLTLEQLITFLGHDLNRYLTPDILYRIDLGLKSDENILLGEQFVYISIPNILHGEKIKEESIIITFDDSENTIVYDKDGKLYRESDDKLIGNVFYTFGTIIITDSDIFDLIYSSGNFVSLAYKSTVTSYEHSFLCTVESHEYNSTYNKTAFESMSYTTDGYRYINGKFKEELNSDIDWYPYITTIGLYNDNSELLAVAKLKNPIKKDHINDLTFLIQIDI